MGQMKAEPFRCCCGCCPRGVGAAGVQEAPAGVLRPRGPRPPVPGTCHRAQAAALLSSPGGALQVPWAPGWVWGAAGGGWRGRYLEPGGLLLAWLLGTVPDPALRHQGTCPSVCWSWAGFGALLLGRVSVTEGNGCPGPIFLGFMGRLPWVRFWCSRTETR